MVVASTATNVIVSENHSPARTALVRVGERLTVREIGRWDRTRARLRAHSLDAQVAAGQPPEDHWLRAVRAGQLSAPTYRHRTADGWAHLLERAERGEHRSWGVVSPRGATRLPSRELITELIDALRSAGPTSAQGVAMAAVLLTDGTGPLYRPRSVEHLPAALAAAIRSLRPDAQLVW